MFQAEEGQSLHLISAKKGGPDPPEENETNLGELRVAVGQETHSQDNCWMSLLMLSKRHSSTTDMESIALGAQELRSMLEWDGIVNKDAVREKKKGFVKRHHQGVALRGPCGDVTRAVVVKNCKRWHEKRNEKE